MLFKALILASLNICFTNAGLLLWSTHELKISPLEEFSTNEFSGIVEKLKNPEVFIFKSPNFLSSTIKSTLNGYYSVYCPNGYIESGHILDLNGDPKEDIKTIKNSIGNSTNFLSAIIIPNYDYTRLKRQLESEDKETKTEKSNKEMPLTGPVIYKSLKVNNKNLYALLYSSKPLLFKQNNSDYPDVQLGNVEDDMIIFDDRLNIYVPLDGRGKVTLRFKFSWQNGYWYMPSVKVLDSRSNKDFNLVTSEDISAQASFSYHCNGESVFKGSNGVELYLYDLQVQIDSKNGKFGDANDCVPFITVPIWSGIFITFIIGIGMVIALMAIMDIKTMDKFDNYKTKNLAITVSE